jgi:hypothetical protein
VPFVRELWSSAEQQQQYLMGVPEGADLATTPLSPPENHYLRITGNSELLKDGTLKGTITLTAEGQTDAGVRGMFFRNSNKTQWFSNIEKELLKISPQAEVTNIEFGDPINYLAGPIMIKIDYQIPEYAVVSGNMMIFTPVVAAGVFRTFQAHLSFDTGLKERKYAFRDRCSRQVELSETIKLPDGVMMISKPGTKKTTGICSFDGGYEFKGSVLTLYEKAVFGKRIYDAKEWPQFRDAVIAQNSFIEEPVILQVNN